jgi:hypothetical protein
MDDYSKVHDEILARVAPLTNFQDEALSSTIFTSMFLISLALFVSAQLLPWRLIALSVGWIAIVTNHPAIQDLLTSPESVQRMEKEEKVAVSQIQAFAKADVILDPAPEKREVEIFELQHRDIPSNTSEEGANEKEWEAWVFTPSPFDPLSPSRIAGDRPKGTRFFEDVQPPKGWKWSDKKWTLDLLSREWVEERCITGVEVEVEGERWVSDIMYELENDVDSVLNSPISPVKNVRTKKSGKESPAKEKKPPVVTWEEGSGKHRLGEWRRRRWVRRVERYVLPTSGKEDGSVVAND